MGVEMDFDSSKPTIKLPPARLQLIHYEFHRHLGGLNTNFDSPLDPSSLNKGLLSTTGFIAL